MSSFIEGRVTVYYPEDMPIEEAKEYLKEQLQEFPQKVLTELKIEILDGEMVQLTPRYDTIIRLRRITGYLSNTKNFNDAKKAEEQARVKHLE